MAAAFLEVSTRTLQRYTTQGRIAVTYKQGKTGAEADYDRDELERFQREKKEREIYRPATQLLTRSEGQSQALAPIDRESLALVGASAAAAIFERLQPTKPSIPIESKPLLKLDEASQLTGLSRQTLREAIEKNRLKAKIVGRAWRIKRDDLDQYLKKL